MARIGPKDTKPELVLRRGLHSMGYRFRLHDRRLPGRPDIYLPKFKTVILANGCFWHGHGCHMFKVPKTRPEFWKQKINANRERDRKNVAALQQLGLQVGIVWECALKGKFRWSVDEVVGTLVLLIEGKLAPTGCIELVGDAGAAPDVGAGPIRDLQSPCCCDESAGRVACLRKAPRSQ